MGEGSAARFHLHNFAQFFVLGSSEPELNRHRWSDEASMLPLHHQSTSHMCAMVVEFTTATVLRQRKGDAFASPFSLQRFLRGCHPRRPRQTRHYLPQVQAGRARNLGPKICITRTRVRRKPLCLGGAAGATDNGDRTKKMVPLAGAARFDDIGGVVAVRRIGAALNLGHLTALGDATSVRR